MGRFDRRVAVITGAARGIGFGIAQRFAGVAVVLPCAALFGGGGKYHTRIEGRDFSPTEQRAITGTGIGAAGGAVIGAIAGNAGLGAGIGAAAGLAGGLLYDQAKKSQTSAYQSGYRAGAQRQAPNPPQ